MLNKLLMVLMIASALILCCVMLWLDMSQHRSFEPWVGGRDEERARILLIQLEQDGEIKPIEVNSL